MPSPSLGDRNFRIPKDREQKSRVSLREKWPTSPNECNAQVTFAVARTAFYPPPAGPHTLSQRPALTLLHQRVRVAGTRTALSAYAFQTNLCKLNCATFPATGKKYLGPCSCFSRDRTWKHAEKSNYNLFSW